MTTKPVKTYKRETAGGMLLVYFGLLVYGVYDPASVGALEAAEQIKLPVFGFASAAFGADVLQKMQR